MHTKSTTRRRISYVAVPTAVVAIAAAGVGVAVAANTPAPINPAKTLHQHSGTATTYARATARTATKSVLPVNAITQVIHGLGAASRITAATWVPGPHGATMTVRLSRNDDGVTSEWYSQLLIGAVGNLLRVGQKSINQEITSATAIGPGNHGHTTRTGLGVGAVTLGQEFKSPPDAAIASHVRAVAKRYGLKVGSLHVIHPIDTALAVTFIVPNKAKINWTIDQLRTALVGNKPDVEGVLIDLQSPSGQTLLQSGVAYRTGDGALSFARGQDTRFGAVHGGMDVAAAH